jgi:hypothetical protein
MPRLSAPAVLSVTKSKSTRPAGAHYPWMETGIVDYGAYRVIHATDGRTDLYEEQPFLLKS